MRINRQPRTLIVAMALGALVTVAPHATPGATLDTLDGFLAALEGGWSGDNNTTPLGEMSFVMLLEREEDGSLHSHSALNRETYIDLRFSRDETGRWMLREEAGMEGLGVQAHTLEPAGVIDGGYRWVHQDNPDYLSVDIALEDDTMIFDVRLRGEDHVGFRLDRLPAEDLPELKRQMEIQASQSPEQGTTISEITGAEIEADDPIARARRVVVESPAAGEAHLALARALGEAINQNPADGPRFASEMLAALERAIELDPSLAEAYHWLAGYYMNAPPIAGGSVAKAENTARRLAEFDAAGAEELLRQIEARRPNP